MLHTGVTRNMMSEVVQPKKQSKDMATYQIPAQEPICCTSEIANNWKNFCEAFEDYATATELAKKDAAVQVSALKSVMGKECKQILNRLELTDDDLKETKTVMLKLEAHFAPGRNILYERYENAEQQANESVDQYLIRLRRLAEACQFLNILKYMQEEMIGDILVLGCRDKAARARNFRDAEDK